MSSSIRASLARRRPSALIITSSATNGLKCPKTVSRALCISTMPSRTIQLSANTSQLLIWIEDSILTSSGSGSLFGILIQRSTMPIMNNGVKVSCEHIIISALGIHCTDSAAFLSRMKHR